MTAPKPRLSDVEARAAAATPGQWEERVDDLTDDVDVLHDQEHVSHIASLGPVSHPRALADATFIAASRTDIPAMAAAIRAVLDVIDETATAYEDAFNRMSRDLMGPSPTTEFSSDDLTRYAAYSSSWRAASTHARKALSAHIDLDGADS